jgi:hypothetical protein
MKIKDWVDINGKRYFRQATYKVKYGAILDAKSRRARGQKVRVLSRANKYFIYVKN